MLAGKRKKSMRVSYFTISNSYIKISRPFQDVPFKSYEAHLKA